MLKLPYVFAFLVLSQATACNSEQLPSSQKDQTQVSAGACPKVKSLFNIVATDKLYEMSPEDFVKASNGILKIKEDEASELAPEVRSRRVTLQSDTPWLQKAEMRYMVSGSETQFDFAHFNISSKCFSEGHAALQLATESFGKSFSDYEFGPPGNAVERTWRRPEADINYIRFISLTTGEDPISLKVERDPAPDEENGDEEG